MGFALRKPARNTRNLAQTVRSKSVPAPVGGWNTRDSLAEMPTKDAVILDNWFPTTSRVDLRLGYSSHSTGLGGTVESLMEYAGPSTRKFFGAASTNIYDITGSGAVGAAAVSGLTNARWQHVNFDSGGAHYLFIVNGADAPRTFDGTTWATPAITGFTAANAIHVNVYQQRIWMIENNTLNAWYLGTLAVAGAATKLNFGVYADKGGYLMAMATWSVDGGAGPRDYAVFITSEGQCIIFEGTDPASASTWQLSGVYEIGRPVGRRCYIKVGGDVVIITEDGFVPLSKQLITGRAAPKTALSDKISGAVIDALANYRNNFGWQPLLYPRGKYALFNIPVQEGAKAVQFVVNTNTGAWCRFVNQNASCWGLFNQDLFFGAAGGVVYQANTGSSDGGANIVGDMEPAFNYFGNPATLKRFTMVRPVFFGGMKIEPLLAINVDFEDDIPQTSIMTSGSNGSLWDVSLWDVSAWSVTNLISKAWGPTTGIGFCGTVRLRVDTQISSISLISLDYVFEAGGFL